MLLAAHRGFASKNVARTIRMDHRRSVLVLAVLGVSLAGVSVAQTSHQTADTSQFRAIPNHVPSWANDGNFVALLPAEQKVSALTLVLARHADRQQAFEQLLADQQNAASPEYHHWLTSQEIGDRFGLPDEEIEAITSWLESEGLHVDLVSPTRDFIDFSGSARDLGHAFQTNLNYYEVKGKRWLSVEADPMVPAEFAPRVKAIRGLYTIEDKPLSQVAPVPAADPAVTAGGGIYYIGPADFATIYDVPSNLTGSGVTVGIVGRARTDFNDFKYFRQATATTFANPTEVVPTAYGGVDPGPALTAPPASGVSIDDQLEATLDVLRVASIAQSAKVLLVVNKSGQQGGTDIGGDARYLILSDPAPAQVINISFGECESEAGSSNVSFWDNLFLTAAGKGISVFVASGDAGASGCDTYFSTPPASPPANSPNYICSSSYAICLGGTEFNDANDYGKYWSSSNGAGLSSALSYIPEGAWNEPLNGNSQPQAASTGGGVSHVVPTPSWQTGKGVPAARAGRYTPDIAFSASAHDGYFGCMAAIGNSTTSYGCVPNSQGQFGFVYFTGTSAAAPDMAGITALLDQKLGGKGQGNLNPVLYPLAASNPSAFHDVTVATSGVTNCSVNTPSMCNNSIPGPSGLSGGQAGFLVTAGYDEATGLGSLDVAKFIDAFSSPVTAPKATTGASSAVTGATATVAGSVNPDGGATQYWFLYGTSSTLADAAKTASQSATGSAAVSVTAKLTGLKPLTKYYFQLQASNSAGKASGSIASFTTGKAAQTITFAPQATAKYGAAAITLSAKASSGLPVAIKLISGPAKLSGTKLTITGTGIIELAAMQAGDATYNVAPEIKRSITVAKALLTVAAKNESMTVGGHVPSLSFKMTGFVNGDTRGTATKGVPTLTTSATAKSPAGRYKIVITDGTTSTHLRSANYTFKFVDGWLYVNK